MALQQRVLAVRRSYNQLVANETMEDYALRYTAAGARKFSTARIAHTAFGATSFLALEAIGGSRLLQYGTVNAVCAIAVVGLLIALVFLLADKFISRSRHGVDIDLLTRAAGFGYIGSHRHLADLCLLHLHLLRHRGDDFCRHAACGVRPAAVVCYICSALAVIPLVA